MTKVSIILTSYNKPLYVAESIESVLQQTEEDWELFIMDDNSNEDTSQVLHSYLRDPRIFYMNSGIDDNKRFQTTRYAVLINQAIPRTTGKYISYLTDDTVYMPNRLQVMLDFFNKNPTVEIVYSSQKMQHLNKNHKVNFEIELTATEVLTRAANMVDHCSVMHTRNIAEKVFSRYGTHWDVDPKYWFNADAVFWTRLNEFAPFYPIQKVLDITKKTPQSYQNLSALLPKVIPDGTVVKGLKEELYLIDEQKLRLISNELFERLKFNTIVEIPDPVLFSYDKGIPICEEKLPNQILVQSRTNHSIYYIQKGQKRLVNDAAFKKYRFNKQKTVILNENHLNQWPDGPELSEHITMDTMLPDGILFSFNGKFYICFDNLLCFLQTDIALGKLQLPLKHAIPMSEEEFSLFKQGSSFTWELPFK
ncbi:maturation of the outermost layer of the spore [Bacillus canaveralius]|uniref:Maturation of the outermost layer of the spore n=1 Tax=Bacillus canaveralius TaxID=1403243 RepID=A0A2N5GIF1_9BACI|nr:glycosyltransferase family 2 protein [Bacillus canaveralius]PLR80756.1 maturation of the outermost layer of the spore [Bacillus canaveralius]PLR98366.1 maturation of the outermost layer of the spore [Bacillus canaveralius]